MRRGTFNEIPICQKADDTGCWISWNTFARGYYPASHAYEYDDALSINPLSWSDDTTYVDYSENAGAVLKNYKKIRAEVADAQNHEGMLWTNKLRFPGSIFFRWKRYHIADYNLYYMNIRQNVQERVQTYLLNNEK